ncbi:hypothetical protein BKI52_29270 [marine bacterium AO1-C]|nr:hypothetical protein BKI52_29270 [marine bacterium AO1-C]
MKNDKSEFMEVVFHKTSKTLELIWLEKTLRLSDRLFRQELKKQTQWVKEHHPTNILIDATQFVFPIAPPTQTWINDQIHCAFTKAGIGKIGILKSIEFISQLSIEQTIEANTQPGLKLKIFEARQTAFDWLMA